MQTQQTDKVRPVCQKTQLLIQPDMQTQQTGKMRPVCQKTQLLIQPLQ